MTEADSFSNHKKTAPNKFPTSVSIKQTPLWHRFVQVLYGNKGTHTFLFIKSVSRYLFIIIIMAYPYPKLMQQLHDY